MNEKRIDDKRLQEIRSLYGATPWINELITALEEMTEAHRLDLEMILELKIKVSGLEADCAIALRQMRIADEGNKKLQAEYDDIQADNLKALELIIEGQAAEVKLIALLTASQEEVERLRKTLGDYADPDYWQDKAYGRGEGKVDFDGEYCIWVGEGENGYDMAQRELKLTV